MLNPSPFEDCILSWQLEKVSLFFINEVEGGQMTQKSEPKDILDQMLFQYPDAAVVLTLGEKGAWYADREKDISARHRGYRRLILQRREILLPDIF